MITSFPSPGIADNIGGSRSFRFVPVEDVTSMAYPQGFQIDGPLTFVSGKNWRLGWLRNQDTGSFSLETVEGVAGTLYKFSLTGFLPRLRKDASALFHEMKECRFLIDYQDNNDNRRLIGDLETGVGFRFSEASGGSPGALNGYAWTFYADLTVAFNYEDTGYTSPILGD